MRQEYFEVDFVRQEAGKIEDTLADGGVRRFGLGVQVDSGSANGKSPVRIFSGSIGDKRDSVAVGYFAEDIGLSHEDDGELAAIFVAVAVKTQLSGSAFCKFDYRPSPPGEPRKYVRGKDFKEVLGRHVQSRANRLHGHPIRFRVVGWQFTYCKRA